MEESEIQKICQQIYSTHKRALDLLFEYRPDRISEIRDFLLDLVANEPTIVADHSSKAYVRFAPAELEFLPRLGHGWTPSGRLIVCELDQSSGSLYLKVILGPGLAAARERINAEVGQHPGIFNRAKTKFYPQWWTMHGEKWASDKQYESSDMEELKAAIRAHFQNFVRAKLPQMVKALESLRSVQLDPLRGQ